MRQLKISQKITNRESEALERYLAEIARIDALIPEEEVTLAGLIKKGDQLALDKLVKANLRFVVSVAKQYQNNGLTLNDLINEGNVGLLKAAKRFDETKGFKFITYAVWWIRQSILQAIVENSRMIRLPHTKFHLYKKINDKFQSFQQEFERDPSPEELSEIFGIDAAEVYNILESGVRHVSLDQPLGEEDSNGAFLDLIGDDSIVSPDFKMLDDSLKEELKMGMRNLSPRERDIINGLFGLDDNESRTMEELAYLYNLSIERVRQIKEHAFRRLKRNLLRSNYKPFSS
ncbi:MAG: RNA polymerase sigma factor RpoD/SigA [Bacteroidota bacterium]|nr:RNA polymerase sigma factor RpoD/SigA [Bacteroidota bacterium]